MALLDICNLNVEIETSNGPYKIVMASIFLLNEGEIMDVGESAQEKSHRKSFVMQSKKIDY